MSGKLTDREENALSDPQEQSGYVAVEELIQKCPKYTESDQPKSIHIDIGWTFTNGAPTGEYTLILAGRTFTGTLDSGHIRIDKKLDSLCGDGSLEIRVTNGPVFRSTVKLDLPAIQTPEGLKRRLTNLGYYAGTDPVFDRRAHWAVRAFKHVVQNGFVRNQTEPETNLVTQSLLTAVQNAYGNAHPDDSITGALAIPVHLDSPACGMFGQRALRRTSTRPFATGDDRDAEGAGDNGTWENRPASGMRDAIAGTFTLFLRAFDAGDPVISNRVNLPQHVRMMQLVLFELGFWVIRGTGGWTTESGTQTRREYVPDGRFGRHAEWAVREFQCYARMENAAEEDVSSNHNRYLPRLLANSPTALTGHAKLADTAPVTGAINEETRDALQAWADRRLRCPVVIYVSTDNSAVAPAANGANFTRLVRENLWRHDDHETTNPRMYAIDWSGYYDIPEAHGGDVNANGGTFPRPIVVGDRQTYKQWKPDLKDYLIWRGPRSIPPRHTWSEGEILPERLTGSAWADMEDAARSTFRVVRAVSEVECYGFFDSVNSYDNAFVSVGPCHWTLGIADSNDPPGRVRTGLVDNGELCGYLAYLREVDEDAFRDAVGFFGIRPNEEWNGNGNQLFVAGSRKYAAWIERQVQTGTTTSGLATPWRTMAKAAPEAKPEADFLKNWHWFYRYVMAGRVNEDYRQRMWHMARVRLRDIRAVPWGVDVANVGINSATPIGDVFTSERATAMILRLHIRGPGWVVNGGNAGSRLTGTLTRARRARPGLTWTGDPSTWTGAHETALIDGLTAELAANATNVQESVDYVRGWAAASWGGNHRRYTLDLNEIGNTLDARRGSFSLDATDLPDAPY